MSTVKELMISPVKAEDRVLRMFREWVNQEPANLARLVQWLEGYSWPVMDSSEPYLRLLHGFRRLDPSIADKFVLRVVEFLSGHPEEKRAGDRPNEVLYNLLRLCGGMNRPDRLAAPLQAMLLRHELTGDFEGANLRAALRDALVRNQTDDALLLGWKAMAMGQDTFLPGDVRDSLEGISRMPSRSGSGPDVEALGWVLARFAGHLEQREERGKVFKAQLERLVGYWGEELREQLPRLADTYGWPSWTCDIFSNSEFPDPAEKNSDCTPLVEVMAELEKLSATEQHRFHGACVEISRRVFSQQKTATRIRDIQADQNQILTQVEVELLRRQEKTLWGAVRRGRTRYMAKRGLHVKQLALASGESPD